MVTVVFNYTAQYYAFIYYKILCRYANLYFKKSHLRALKYFLNISFYNMKYMFTKLGMNH